MEESLNVSLRQPGMRNEGTIEEHPLVLPHQELEVEVRTDDLVHEAVQSYCPVLQSLPTRSWEDKQVKGNEAKDPSPVEVLPQFLANLI